MTKWLSLLRRPSMAVALLVFVAVGVVWGVTAARASAPPSTDQRVYSIGSQLQCPVCNGESVADAPSAVAQEMRSVIREKIAEGWTDQQILDYFHQRYGDTILETPPAQGFTAIIWLGPLLMLLAGAFIVWSAAREWSRRAPTAEAVPALAAPAVRGSNGHSQAMRAALTDDERRRYLTELRRELDLDEMPITSSEEAGR